MRRNQLADRSGRRQVMHFSRAREIARLNIMDRILRALGPPFGEKLPKAPNRATLVTVPTPIRMHTEPCPYKYKRCSSQTFFASCSAPNNSDPELWRQQFNLFFNMSRDFNTRLDLLNATLRLYKVSTLSLNVPRMLQVKVFQYTRKLNRRRHKTKLMAMTNVSSDYIGWVTLPAEVTVKKWRRRRLNHGLLVTVRDGGDMPYDARLIFVAMDCDSGLLPLPLEVETEEEGQKYPTLNVRTGVPSDKHRGRGGGGGLVGAVEEEEEEEEGEGEGGIRLPVPSFTVAPPPPSYHYPFHHPYSEDDLENTTASMQSDAPFLYDYDYTVPLYLPGQGGGDEGGEAGEQGWGGEEDHLFYQAQGERRPPLPHHHHPHPLPDPVMLTLDTLGHPGGQEEGAPPASTLPSPHLPQGSTEGTPPALHPGVGGEEEEEGGGWTTPHYPPSHTLPRPDSQEREGGGRRGRGRGGRGGEGKERRARRKFRERRNRG